MIMLTIKIAILKDKRLHKSGIRMGVTVVQLKVTPRSYIKFTYS